jgi:hypothetical protein
MSLIATIDVGSILITLVAAGIGATTVAVVSRHLRRQELYVEAAQKINDYLDEASEALNAIDPSNEFDAERIAVAQRAVGLALFHSRRLESEDISARLEVTGSILYDILDEEGYKGRFWTFRAIDEVMAGVVEYTILPRLWPPRREFRPLPPSRLPESSSQYLAITEGRRGDG